MKNHQMTEFANIINNKISEFHFQNHSKSLKITQKSPKTLKNALFRLKSPEIEIDTRKSLKITQNRPNDLNKHSKKT
jgi:hypothetical protein